jgi:hypothetical protein
MSKENADMVKNDVQQLITDGDLTPEEAMELGIWLTGKGIGAAWTAAVEGNAPD